jgi:hypothetical protein
MAEQKQRKSPKGSVAEPSGGQPNLDVDKLMEVVNAHQESSETPDEAKDSGKAQAESEGK